MSQVQISLPDYLRPPCKNVWAWSDRGEAIVWSRNTQYGPVESTVAFAPQVAIILRELHQRLGGLPPLTCILEVIDACKTGWQADACSQRLIRLATAARQSPAVAAKSTAVVANKQWLRDIHQLPAELRSDVKSQLAILTFALQDARQFLFEVSGVDANDVIACVAVEPNDRDIQWVEAAAAVPSVVRVKRTFETLFHMRGHAIDADTLQLWRATDVAALPTPYDIETPPPKNPITQSLRELAVDKQWGAVARSALVAASLLSLPRRPSDPDHLPIGGVSDVTNRGEPERLLMTELAQDPMVMLARIANGQALYLRRESPPGPSPEVRPVFLEAGIRTWGSTRLKIAAVAMAIAAAEERRGQSQAQLLTVAGSNHYPEDFTTSAGMVAHLARTEPDEHPGEAIFRWLASLDQQEHPIAEPVVVVSAATAADERFRRALDTVASDLLIARVERDQSVTLLRRTPLGDQQLQSLSLSDAKPSSPVTSAASPAVRTPESSLALFLDVHPCPLLFTDSLDGSWLAATDAPGLFTITQDHRLLWFATRGAGGVQLLDRMPHAYVWAYETSSHRVAMVVGTDEHYLVEADATNGNVKIVRLSDADAQCKGYQFDDGSLLRFGRRQVQLIDRNSGTIADQIDSQFRHLGGAVLGNDRHLTLLSEQAGKLTQHALVVDGDQVRFVLATRDSNNMVVGIQQDYSKFIRFAGDQTEQHPSQAVIRRSPRPQPPQVVYRSANGDQLVVSDEHARHPESDQDKHLSINLADHSVATIQFSNRRTLLYQLDPAAYQLVQPRNYLSRFTGVEFGHDGSLAIVKRNRQWSLLYDEQFDKLMLRPNPAGLNGARHHFGPMQHLDRPFGRTRWNLRPVHVGNHQVIADSRGLLHLRNGDDGTELTLMLHQDHVSGWTSWGERFGDAYYLSGKTLLVSAGILHWIEEFARQCHRSS